MVIEDRGLKNSQIRRYTDLCAQNGAVNLAQGLFHVECSPVKRRFVEAYKRALDTGLDKPGYLTYVSYKGIPELRKLIAAAAKAYNHLPATEDDVIVTVGALGAFNCALEAVMRPDQGHEAILFQPFYSFHRDQLYVKGLKVRAVTLHPPDWTFTREDLEAVASPTTRVIVVNTPANPSGKVFTRDELVTIADFCRDHDLIAITDEVYGFMVFDGREHISIGSLPEMWPRTITISSFGKMLGATGARIGYAIAPEHLVREMSYSNEYEVACAPAPAQWAATEVMDSLEPYLEHRTVFAAKRDILCAALEKAGFHFWRPAGAAYILADVTRLMNRWGVGSSEEITLQLMKSPGIATVPAIDFYLNDIGTRQIRFCFGVLDEDLRRAARLLGGFHTETANAPVAT